MKTTTATLEQLRPGHEYPGTSVNSRTAYRDTDIEQIAASLLPANDGQLKPLLCCTHPSKPGVFFVFDGNRRRSGFGLALSRKQIEKSHPIEIKDFGAISPEEALRKSWAANEQVPLHPADRYAVFAQINAQGAAPAEIAEKFGMTTRAVEQSLAFGGSLAPEVLQAWRGGLINADIAKIFTLGDKEDQVAELEKLQQEYKRWHGSKSGEPLSEMYQVENRLRKGLTGNEAEAARLLKFVGEEAYLAEGGKIVKDLFGEKESAVVQDVALLKKLARAKLKVRADKLTEEGWSWVEISLSPNFHDYNYDKSKDMKKAGCVVRIAGTRIEAKTGLVKKMAGAGGGGVAQPARRDEPELDYKARNTVEDARSLAAGAVLQLDRKTALATLAASFAMHGGSYNEEGPLGIEFYAPGLDDLEITSAKKWRDAFKEFRALEMDALVAIVAQCVGAVVKFGDDPDQNEDALLATMDPEAFRRGVAKAFNAKVYFKGASAKHLLKCIEEALGADEKRRQEKKGKDALVKFCIDSVAPTGWLPAALRTQKIEKAAARKKAA